MNASAEPAPPTAKQLAELRALLLAKRDELLAKGKIVQRRISEGRENQAEDMDAATDASEDAEAFGIAAQDQTTLALIERALRKMELNTYGFSEDSEEPIGYPRLRAVPWARRTVQEEEMRERKRR
jgi:DnaK suppressor protein